MCKMELIGILEFLLKTLNGDLSIGVVVNWVLKNEDKVERLIEHKFFLEVSSPGLERPLKKIEDYIRFRGEKNFTFEA